jgi:hypothetical protein
VSSLSGNIERFGMETIARMSLQKIIAEMIEIKETNDRRSADVHQHHCRQDASAGSFGPRFAD